MSILRLSTWVVSAALHGALLITFAAVSESTSLDAGSGADQLKVEQGIALEGLVKLGEAMETIETVEAPPVQQAVEAPPEQKPDELTEVITAKDVPVEETVAVAEEPPPLVEEKPVEETRVEQQPQQVAVLELKSSARQLTGGDANALKAFKGSVFAKISRNARAPSRRTIGTVKIAFTIRADGQLVGREIVESSGSKVLDEAAIATLERAAPFPPFPVGINDDELQLTIPFEFR